jgi:hypothetical protein
VLLRDLRQVQSVLDVEASGMCLSSGSVIAQQVKQPGLRTHTKQPSNYATVLVVKPMWVLNAIEVETLDV